MLPKLEVDYLTLPEVVTRWDNQHPMHHIISHGAEDKLRICVMAQDWPAKITDGSNRPTFESENDVKPFVGWVELLLDDLSRFINKDEIDICCARLPEDTYAHFQEPVTIGTANLNISRQELESFEDKYDLLPSDWAKPPYLDGGHKNFSKELEAAVMAWLALCRDDSFGKKKSPKSEIEAWLKKNYSRDEISKNAIDRIATLVNPNKGGGAPPTG